MQGGRVLTWSTLQKSRSQPVMGSSRLSEMVAFLARRQDRERVCVLWCETEPTRSVSSSCKEERGVQGEMANRGRGRNMRGHTGRRAGGRAGARERERERERETGGQERWRPPSMMAMILL
jgi:hypothetical protein